MEFLSFLHDLLFNSDYNIAILSALATSGIISTLTGAGATAGAGAGALGAAAGAGALGAAGGAGALGAAGAAGGAKAGLGTLLKSLTGEQVQGGLGLIQTIQGAVKGRRANQSEPPLEDPRQLELLQKVQRQQKAFETGTAFEPERQAIAQQLAGTQRGVLRASGGASGAAIAGLARSQRAAARSLQDITRARLQQSNILQQMFSEQLGRTAQRKLEIQLLQRAQNLAESAQQRKEGLANVLSAVGQTVPIGQQGGGQ